MAAVDALLEVRTLGFRIASPFEQLMRHALGLEQLPPLWLRRHTGAPGRFRSAARETSDLLQRLHALPPRARILDVGCGCGALAFELEKQLGAEGRYLGFDVHGPCIDWCRETFGSDERFSFTLAPIDSPYSAGAGAEKAPPGSFRFPAEDGSIDLVVAKSVFTHMETGEMQHYFAEAHRVLSDDGAVFATFFMFDERKATPVFPHPRGRRSVMRWRRKLRPHAAIAYERRFLEQAVHAAGFTTSQVIEGFWPGDGLEIRGQDQLLLRKRSRARE